MFACIVNSLILIPTASCSVQLSNFRSSSGTDGGEEGPLLCASAAYAFVSFNPEVISPAKL